eukprot:scaffold103701_cov32-Attheya_sp.AAC.4
MSGGTPSFASHTQNHHIEDNTAAHTQSEFATDNQSFQSNIVGVSLFGDDTVNSTVQNDASSPRTDIMSGGTQSFASHTQNHHDEGNTAANTQSEFATDNQSFQSNIVGVSLFGDDTVNSTVQNNASLP